MIIDRWFVVLTKVLVSLWWVLSYLGAVRATRIPKSPVLNVVLDLGLGAGMGLVAYASLWA